MHYFTAVLIGLCLGVLGVAFHLGYAQLAKLRMEGYFHFAEQRQWGLAFAVNSAISIAYLILPCAATLWRPVVGGSGIPGLLAFLNGAHVQPSYPPSPRPLLNHTQQQLPKAFPEGDYAAHAAATCTPHGGSRSTSGWHGALRRMGKVD